MKVSTKWLASFMAAAMIGTSLAPAYAATTGTGNITSSVSDLQGHWAAADIGKWMNNGVISGYPDGTFQPNKSINRAEFVTIINQIFGFTAASAVNFTDVSASTWYAQQFAIAKEAGYYEGFEKGQARATTEISRQDAVTLLARAFSLGSGENATFASSFKDSGDIQKYALDAVNAFAGKISGYPDGSFKPKGEMTRAEAVTLLDQLVAGYYTTTGSSEAATIDGSVIINQDGANLKGATINGNLYLAPGIGNGEVKLDGITVKGTTFVWGGGEHTITFNNAKLGKVEVNRPDGLVRVLTTGATQIDSISIESKSRLELGAGTKVDSVLANNAVALLIADGASISNLTVNQEAAGTTIAGQGNITNAIIKAAGITVNGAVISVGTIAVVNGVSAPITAGVQTPTPTTNNGSGTVTPAPTPIVDFVDMNATAETRSLFAYLEDIRGKHILFGQQHATTEGMSITEKNGTQSDAYNAVGAYPAVFGWDTLSLEGHEKPGVSGNFEQSRDNLIDVMKKAYAQNGVLNLSSHMPNFVTGGDFYDLKGSVVSTILPGGSNNEKFNLFLDNIADFANHLKTDDGQPIPVIFRPFHEQSGSWFWWGAAFTTKDQYKELYRYTVEYLRDQKGVHNFLYAYSPGGGFGDNEEKYLETYPGDDYVDILGFDSYYNGEGQGWFDSVVKETKLVSNIADRKNKVAALTEFGYQKMQVSGNTTPDFYTRLAAALKSDPDSKRMAYMLTWANFGAASIYVPYPTGDPTKEHEMLADFKAYYNDDYSLFSDGVTGAYNRNVNAAVEKPFMHIASPTNQGTISTSTTKIRVRILNETAARVAYSVYGSTTETPMTLDAEGFYYTADWSPAASLNGKMTTITVKVYDADNTILQEQTNTVFVKIAEVLLHSYTFDEDIAGIQNNGGYQANISSIAHQTLDGNGVLALSVTNAVYSDTWQEMKLELTNAKSVVNSDTLTDVSRVKFDAWVPVAAGSPEATPSLRAVVQLPPDWDTKYGMESQVAFSAMPKVTINGVEYVKYSATIDLPDVAKREAASDIALSLVGSGLDSGNISFPMYIDNIQLYSTYVEASSDPAVVDNFEDYLGSTLALQTKFVHAGGDIAAASLDVGHKYSGSYGMKYTYTLGGNGYTGITKAMGGADWSGFNALQFWYQPDALGQKLVIQINANGKTYEYYPDTTTTTAQFVTAKFSDFKPANGATGTLTKLNLNAIQAFSIYTNAVPNGTTLTSEMYFDDIKAVNDPDAGTVPNGSVGGGITLGTLFNFDDSLQDWTFGQNTVGATNLANSTDGSSKVLSVDFPNFFPMDANFELNYIGNKDLSSGNILKLKVRIAAGSAKAKLFIKTGGSWAWADSGEFALTTDYQWITLNLDGKDVNQNTIDKTLIQAMGLQISAPSGPSSPLTVYVDDITLE
ncbi:glycosyl hydrolase [Paenibacillus monticola]|uniref:Beta-mannosidase n=1 Tax=Paenibacillus monticola TaxID=2666075 RepID=A0A7X2HAB5_9BACL|nr:glycosyl hydrolase [Paenibacillus monticola]MRN56428.1 beta-mannosidase [Paenibacillus monticola]